MRKIGRIALISALMVGLLATNATAITPADGTVLFHLNGATSSYSDTWDTRVLGGTPTFSAGGRAFGARLEVAKPKDARLGATPYGVFGLTPMDRNFDGDYLDDTDDDPARLLEDMASEGVYNLALSATLGRVQNEAELIRIFDAAKRLNIRLVVRATALLVVSSSGTFKVQDLNVSDEKLSTPDDTQAAITAVTTEADYNVLDEPTTRQNLERLKRVFAARPDLESVVYSWYSVDEPMQRNMTLDELRRIYNLYKEYFPVTPVFVVFNQSQALPDSNGDRISDGMLGQPENPFGAGVADIVGLNIYNATPNYDYSQIRVKFAHGRKVVNQYTPSAPVWAVPQGHALANALSYVPRPHHIYRQINDWMRTGPDTGLRGVDGFLWYSWHLNGAQNATDIESNYDSRRMVRTIGEHLHRNATFVTHAVPYKQQLYVPPRTTAPLRAFRDRRINLYSGTLSMSVSRFWRGNDSGRHVLFDTGASTTANRMTLEKGADNVLRLTVRDVYGKSKWVGLNVDATNMVASGTWSPGYSEIVFTWLNGQLSIYLDGKKGDLAGGDGSGKLSAGGTYMFLGSDMAGQGGLDGTIGHVTIRRSVLTDAEVYDEAFNQYMNRPARVVLSTPTNGAITTDRTPYISWQPVANATRYRLEVSLYPDFRTLTRGYTLTRTSRTLPTVSPGTYYWRVRALDRYSMGVWSPTWKVVVK